MIICIYDPTEHTATGKQVRRLSFLGRIIRLKVNLESS